MPEIQKYNTREELKIADEKYKGSTSLLGISSLTQPMYTNSTRTQMFTAHTRQFLDLITPEFPKVFTNAENTVGKNSSGYTKTKKDYEVVKRVDKFGDILENPFIAHLFVYNKKEEKYYVFSKNEVEDSLTEDYGFHYNNEEFDKYNDGDKIKKGTVLTKSNSYDEDMNYRYGVNALVGYCLNPFTSEDAAEISESFSKKMTTTKVDKVMWGLNDNDIPLDLYGDGDEYKPYPDIGEPAIGVFGASRTLYTDQILYDFKDSNLSRIKDTDRPICYNGKGFIVDYEIFCNNPDIKETEFNHQILKYLKSQRKYYKEIFKITKKIRESGSKYERDIDYLYRRAKDFLDMEENTKWVKDDYAFGGLKIRATIAEYVPLKVGHKFSGRFGNKSVVSRVVPDDEMPYDPITGKCLDVKLNLLAIMNRTTGFVPHELFITFICNRTREQLQTMDSLEEQEKLLFDIVKDLNKDQYVKMYAYYKQLSVDKKKEYIQSCIDDGVFIHQNNVEEDEYILIKLMKMVEKYPFLEPYQLYVDVDGQKMPQLRKTYLGEMYLIRLKQVDNKQFSGRNTGSINMKELPERSYRNRSHQDLFSDTPIQSGEYETLSILTALDEEELALFHAFYRSSIKGRRDFLSNIFYPNDLCKIDDSLTSRVAEIFHVIFKSLALELEFIDEDSMIMDLDNKIEKEHEYKGQIYMMTDFDFHLFKIEQEIREEVLEENTILTTDELEDLVQKRLNDGSRMIGKIRDEVDSPDEKITIESK